MVCNILLTAIVYKISKYSPYTVKYPENKVCFIEINLKNAGAMLTRMQYWIPDKSTEHSTHQTS